MFESQILAMAPEFDPGSMPYIPEVEPGVLDPLNDSSGSGPESIVENVADTLLRTAVFIATNEEVHEIVIDGSGHIAQAAKDLIDMAQQCFVETVSAISSMAGGNLISGSVSLAVIGAKYLARAAARLISLGITLAPLIVRLTALIDSIPTPRPIGAENFSDLSCAGPASGAPRPADSPIFGSSTTSNYPGALGASTPGSILSQNPQAIPTLSGVAESALSSQGTGGHASAQGNASPQALQAVEAAKSALGTPYVWGGTTPGAGFDCSGMTQWAYKQAGVDIPRLAEQQNVGPQVSRENLLPGDLAVWDGHVAMIVDSETMIEAGNPVQYSPVRTTNMNMQFMGFYRPTG